MSATITDAVELVWDLARERPTLGGALVLRQEGELLARLRDQPRIDLHLIGGPSNSATVTRLINTVFRWSNASFRITEETPSAESWPTPAARECPEFSNFSFSRVTALHQKHGITPHLHWNPRHERQTRAARSRFQGRLVCLHLRSVSPFTPQESNADGAAWNAFLAAHARPGSLDFLLLGDDPLPSGLTLRAGVSRATDHGLDLATQLTLAGCADGFLGMASGLCTAANFSAVPHVIFKHPAHHAAAMARELGAADRFSFAEKNQCLWRREATADALHDALALISS
jgi:hypothetical protein